MHESNSIRKHVNMHNLTALGSMINMHKSNSILCLYNSFSLYRLLSIYLRFSLPPTLLFSLFLPCSVSVSLHPYPFVSHFVTISISSFLCLSILSVCFSLSILLFLSLFMSYSCSLSISIQHSLSLSLFLSKLVYLSIAIIISQTDQNMREHFEQTKPNQKVQCVLCPWALSQ